MKKVLVCLAVLLVALSVQAQMSDSTGGGVDKQIIALEQKWAQAQKASDTGAIAPMLADKFVIVFADGRVMNKAQTLDDSKKSKMDSVDVSDLKVTSYGNTAVVTGVWKGKGTDGDGKPMDDRERFIDTWHKSADGKWQCIGSGNTMLK
jgi:ketosteroid isomerase-like protein